jgi:hypothetical protein
LIAGASASRLPEKFRGADRLLLQLFEKILGV